MFRYVVAWTFFVFPIALAQRPQSQNSTTILPPTAPPPMCLPIVQIPICEEMPWNYTFLPNLRGQTSLLDAHLEVQLFQPLIEERCSQVIAHFLCSIYAPFCDPERPTLRTRPCRRLCEHMRDGCEETFFEKSNLPWPDVLVCEQYDNGPLCFGPKTDEELEGISIPPALLLPGPPTDSPPPEPILCPKEMVVSENIENKSFEFGGISNCAPNCGGIYFTESQRNIVAPLFILLFGVACILFTLFTIATFCINRNRFNYPQRPIVYLSVSYLIFGLGYFIGAVAKLAGGGENSFACSDSEDDLRSRFVFQNLPNDNVTMSTASCVILFLLVYYTQMTASLWWVILTFTWFLATVLKWGEEAVEKLWPLYHVIAWSVPAVQVILVLSLRLVDGDQVSGVCYPGQFSSVGLGVFVFMPLVIYLTLGTVFLIIGFSALINIRRELEQDPIKSRKLGRLIIRIGVYSALYIVPNTIVLIIHIYELAERERWEESYIEHDSCRDEDTASSCPSSPNFAAFLIRYILLLCVGICATSWVFSKKTLDTWTRFFQSCGCINRHSRYNSKRAYELPEKDPSQLQTAV